MEGEAEGEEEVLIERRTTFADIFLVSVHFDLIYIQSCLISLVLLGRWQPLYICENICGLVIYMVLFTCRLTQN